ncbi:MAG: beta-lactamase family protein [Planctomycetes bacterium]|nr:beta-lactamase family protein [Actinomycetota bacterium]MBM4023260.1 beta-lactamase family protein [Planctomycetota bacterium]
MTRWTKALLGAAALGTAAALLAPTGAGAQPSPRGDVTPPATSSSTLPSGATTRLNAALLGAWADLPGGAMATVIVPGRGRWVGTVGYANDERKRAMTPDRQSPIGSVTKTFTGMLVLQEVAAGRIDLDDRLDRWYPAIPKADEITIAMLLNMSSGISDYLNTNIPGFAEELMKDPKQRYRPDDLIEMGAALPREFDVPGTGLAYSNTNTVILARILEKETGKEYAALLKSRLFEPLGMSRSFLDVSGDLQSPHAQTYSDVFSIDPSLPPLGRTTNWSQSYVWAAGGMASTINDLGRWGRALGTGRGAIPASLAAERLDNCAPSAAGSSTDYCLGLVVNRDVATGEPVTLWHNGRVFGAVAYVGYYPATGAVVAVMANCDMEGPDGQHVSMRAKEAIEAAVPGLLGL